MHPIMPMALASVIACFAVWVFVFRLRAHHPLDPFALMLFMILVQLIIRPATFAMGFDLPQPDEYFDKATIESTIIQGELLVTLWLVCLAVGGSLTTNASRLFQPALPHIPAYSPPQRVFAISVLFTVVAVATFVVLFFKYGGLGEMIIAIRREKELAGYYSLRQFSALGAFLSAAYTLQLIRFRYRGEINTNLFTILMGFMLVLINGLCVFSWGNRGAAVFSLMAVTIGVVIYRKVNVPWSTFVRIGIVFIVLAAGLRVARDYLFMGHLAQVIEDQDPVRQVFVATNLTYFDAFMLVIDKMNHGISREGEDFRNAFAAVIPRSLWPGKPDVVTPGSWLRQEYEKAANGWPFGVVGEWYTNFKLAGVIIGGLFTGGVFRVIQVRYSDFLENPFSLVFSIIMVTKVFEMGVINVSPMNYVLFCAPLLVISRLLQPPRWMREHFEAEEYEDESFEEEEGDDPERMTKPSPASRIFE